MYSRDCRYFDFDTSTVGHRSCIFDWLDIYWRRFDGVAIYFLKSDFKFFDDASRHPYGQCTCWKITVGDFWQITRSNSKTSTVASGLWEWAPIGRCIINPHPRVSNQSDICPAGLGFCHDKKYFCRDSWKPAKTGNVLILFALFFFKWTAISQLVTRSTRHTCVSSHSQLVTSEHKDTSCKIFYLHAGQVTPRNNVQYGRCNYGKQAYNYNKTCTDTSDSTLHPRHFGTSAVLSVPKDTSAPTCFSHKMSYRWAQS